MPRSGSTLLSVLLEQGYGIKTFLSPYFSYGTKKIFQNITKETDFLKVLNDVKHSEDEFFSQEKNRDEGFIPPIIDSTINPNIICIKDTRNLFDYIQLSIWFPEIINIIFIRRNLNEVIDSWLNSPERKSILIDEMEVFFGTKRKNIENDPSSEYWGIADYIFYDRLVSDVVHSNLKDNTLVLDYNNGFTEDDFKKIGVSFKITPQDTLQNISQKFNNQRTGSYGVNKPNKVRNYNNTEIAILRKINDLFKNR
jgi:hypothetical protein